MAKIVVALGGNALGQTPEEQLAAVSKAATAIVDLIAAGHKLIVTHGNGPQVGMIKKAADCAHKNENNAPYIALKECGAMSQGYIGYHLQQAIENECCKRQIKQAVAAITTQVEVAPDDPAFQHPTKPVGNFYTESEARIMSEQGFIMQEDAGRGYRQVVASPLPVKIIELKVIKTLVENNVLVITVGGGGIPVIKTPKGYQGIDAVIDKDNSSSLLADAVDADCLLILTAVEKVAINFNTPAQQNLSRLDYATAEKYIAEGQFAKGSMLPKIQACLNFVHQKPERKAVIANLFTAREALQGNNGTVITD